MVPFPPSFYGPLPTALLPTAAATNLGKYFESIMSPLPVPKSDYR